MEWVLQCMKVVIKCLGVCFEDRLETSPLTAFINTCEEQPKEIALLKRVLTECKVTVKSSHLQDVLSFKLQIILKLLLDHSSETVKKKFFIPANMDKLKEIGADRTIMETALKYGKLSQMVQPKNLKKKQKTSKLSMLGGSFEQKMSFVIMLSVMILAILLLYQF
jgi:hypothetical protein